MSRPSIAAKPISKIDSSALPPMCGVAKKFGKLSSSMSIGGSCSNTSKAAAANFSFFSKDFNADSSTSPPLATLISIVDLSTSMNYTVSPPLPLTKFQSLKNVLIFLYPF